MSGRSAIAHSTIPVPVRGLAAVGLALVCGLAVAVGGAAAQPESPPPGGQATQSKNDLSKIKKRDAENPVTADARHAASYQKYAMPGTDRLMFSKIEEFKPEVASEEQNQLEYGAWCEFVVQAAKFPAAELEQHGVRDLTVIDLLKSLRDKYRCELLRFDGKLVCVRRLKAPLFFQNNPDSKVKELYEARFVPVDESPLTPVSVVFLDLPESLKAVRDKPFKEWVDVDAWVSAAGYYFKTMSVPGEQGGTVGVPLLVGRSVTRLPGPPAPPGNDPTAIEPVRLFKFIRDDAPLIRSAPTDVTWPELAAFQRVLLHANRFNADDLEKHANPDVRFADLFEDTRTQLQLKNIKMEGRLISLRKMEANNELRAAKIDAVYEGWLVPKDEPRGNPVCIFFTQPLEGVEPTGRGVSKWVSFAGFSFKLMRYESAEQYEDAAKGYKVKRAPVLIGKGPIPRRDPEAPVSMDTRTVYQAAVIAGALFVVTVGGLTWWFRSGDRRAKESIEAARGRNPFDPNAAPPPRN
jgi:hypothetical protein